MRSVILIKTNNFRMSKTQACETAIQDLFHGFVESNAFAPSWEEFRDYPKKPNH